MIRLQLVPWLVLLAMPVGMGCQDSNVADVTVPPARRKPTIYTTFYPTQYFAQRIAGDFAAVVCPVPEDADPICWMPDASIIGDYQQADLIILNGASFAKWVELVSLPDERVVDSSRSLARDFIHFQESVTHTHGPGGSHSHEGVDGHTWVDPVNAKTQAATITAALSEKYPKHATTFKQNFAKLAADLDELHTALEAYRGVATATPLLASHPAYNYVARRYDWNIKNLDLDPEQMPNSASIDQIGTLLKDHPAKFILWESAPKSAIAERLKAEFDLTSIVFAPCELLTAADRKAGLDYRTIMRQNVQNVARVFPVPAAHSAGEE